MSANFGNNSPESSEHLRASQLRRALEEAGAPWSLDDDIDDEFHPPEFPLGGELPPDAPRVDQVAATDFKALLGENPPGDPDLARFCVEAGLLDPEVALSAERPPYDQRLRPAEDTPPDIESPYSDQPLAPDDVAPPLFGERSDRVEPK
jgi:hypothetical protein